MQSHRLEVRGRDLRLLIAHRGMMQPSEASEALPPTEACALLDGLPDKSVAALVDAFGYRFPNTREPNKTRRVMVYLRERVASGALGVVRRG